MRAGMGILCLALAFRSVVHSALRLGTDCDLRKRAGRTAICGAGASVATGAGQSRGRSLFAVLLLRLADGTGCSWNSAPRCEGPSLLISNAIVYVGMGNVREVAGAHLSYMRPACAW